MCRYLNDVYTLEIREGTSLQWVCPNIEGPAPCPRESPAAVTIGTNRLLIYGGMNGKRLGDVWILDVGKQLLVLCVCGEQSAMYNLSQVCAFSYNLQLAI